MRAPAEKDMNCSEVNDMDLYFAVEGESAKNCCINCAQEWKAVELTYAKRIYMTGFLAGKKSEYKTVMDKAKERGEL